MDLKPKIQNRVVDYWRFLGVLLGIVVFVFLTFGYISTELNTYLYASQITNVDELCSTYQNQDFKYVKVLQYEKSINQAEIYCIYGDSNKNIDIDMSFEGGKWQPYLTLKLNKNRNFYWPIYI
jgi:hypothetical protein